MISLGFNSADAKRVAWTFAQAFLATFAGGLAGVFGSGTVTRQAVLAAGAAALAAALSALKNALLSDGSTLK